MDESARAARHAWYDALPASLKERAVDLSPQRINYQAFQLADALKVLEHLRGQRWAIYGGDFYRRAASGPRWIPTHDSWYVEREADEAGSMFVARSLDVARSEITERLIRNRRLGSRDNERVVLVAAAPGWRSGSGR